MSQRWRTSSEAQAQPSIENKMITQPLRLERQHRRRSGDKAHPKPKRNIDQVATCTLTPLGFHLHCKPNKTKSILKLSAENKNSNAPTSKETSEKHVPTISMPIPRRFRRRVDS